MLEHWLTLLNGKTVEKILQVDFNEARTEDPYRPWLFFLQFSDWDQSLEIEGDLDGDHITLRLLNQEELSKRLAENNLPEEPYLWSVYETSEDEIVYRLIGQRIHFIEYGIDIEDTPDKQKELFDFITFHCKNLQIAVFDNLGLNVSNVVPLHRPFEDLITRFTTK